MSEHQSPSIESQPTEEQIEAQNKALETYRPNFIAGYQEDIDIANEKILAEEKQINKNIPLHRRMGKNIMNAMSYVPGLDIAVGKWEESVAAEQIHNQSNLDRWRRKPDSTRLERANEMYIIDNNADQSQPLEGSKRLNAKYKKHQDTLKRQQTIVDLQNEIKQIQARTQAIKDGAEL